MKSWGHWPCKPLSVTYPSTTWARAYTDGSAERAAKNGGGGVFIKLPKSRPIRKSVAKGQQSTNYRAEACVLLAAAQTLNQEEKLPTNTVFLTDCPVHPAVFRYHEGTRSSAASDRGCPCLRTKHLWPSSGFLLTVVLEAMRKQTGCQKWELH